MSNIELIGISGKAGSGKDHITQHFFRPDGFFQFSLAWHFKVWLVAKGEATYEEVFVTKPPHVRKLLQLEGTEFGRLKYGENVWCQSVLTWLRLFQDAWGINKFVIPDVRFPNEVEFIKANQGVVYRIQAPRRVASSGLSEEARAHISETALDEYPLTNYDGLIFNDPEYAETISAQLSILRGLSPSADTDTGEFEAYEPTSESSLHGIAKSAPKSILEILKAWELK